MKSNFTRYKTTSTRYWQMRKIACMDIRICKVTNLQGVQSVQMPKVSQVSKVSTVPKATKVIKVSKVWDSEAKYMWLCEWLTCPVLEIHTHLKTKFRSSSLTLFFPIKKLHTPSPWKSNPLYSSRNWLEYGWVKTNIIGHRNHNTVVA